MPGVIFSTLLYYSLKCFYSEYHIHDKKCKILENPDIHLLEKEEIDGGNKVKICCCSPNIPTVTRLSTSSWISSYSDA